jgi:hypothetical protein
MPLPAIFILKSTSVFNCLQRKFPTQLNREFSEAYQGKFFKEQGIFTPDASILNFEQPQVDGAPRSQASSRR